MQSLAVRYRPTNFEEVCGQNSTVAILKRQIETNEISHSMIFEGSSGCVDDETEFFNGKEWKSISQYDNDDVLIYDNDGNAFLEKPQRYIVDDCDKMTQFVSKYGMNMCLSDEHRIIYESYRGKLHEITCEELMNTQYVNGLSIGCRFIRTTFNYEGNGIDLSDDIIRLMIAASADATIRCKNTGNCCFNLKRERKINRIRELLINSKLPYTETKQKTGYVRFYVNIKDIFKEFPSDWYNCNRHQFEVIANEIMYWDGDFVSKKRYSTTIKRNADFIQFVYATLGYRTSIRIDERKNKCQRNICYDVIITTEHKSRVGFPRCLSDIKIVTPNNNKKYCFTVSTGMWVMRRGNRIAITGNCGKTTSARIFANAIDSEIIEIDGASNNGVENVRNITSTANERSISNKYKTYIIDEAHMITTAGWNAFLKTVEEPPAYTVFIFCTTDSQKIPTTIQNRCQKFKFTRISNNEIMNRLTYICKCENIEYDDASIEYISKISDGGMRDAICNLEKVITFNEKVNIENTLKALGTFSYDTFFKLINAIIDDNEKDILSIINDFYMNGNDLKLFVNMFFEFIIDVNKYILFKDFTNIKIPSIMQKDIKYSTNIDDAKKIYAYYMRKLLELKNMLKDDNNIKDTIDVVFLGMGRYEE